MITQRINSIAELNHNYVAGKWSLTYFEALGLYISGATVIDKDENGKLYLRPENNYLETKGH